MTLYKFKSLSNFEYVADILINKRLYASSFKNLNDPMEGVFSAVENGSFIDDVEEEKEKLKVCSLSKRKDNPALWAYYADSFRGVCIEIELDTNIVEYEEINYTPVTALVGSKPMFGGFDNEGNAIHETISAQNYAKIILRNKYEEWSHEEEVRLFSTDKYIKSGFDIKAIYCGMRMSKVYRDVLERITDSSIKINTLTF